MGPDLAKPQLQPGCTERASLGQRCTSKEQTRAIIANPGPSPKLPPTVLRTEGPGGRRQSNYPGLRLLASRAFSIDETGSSALGAGAGYTRTMQRAIGISVHTGWGACVVVGGSPRKPEIIGNKVIELLGARERFCYHRAATMKPALVKEWLGHVRAKAIAQARSALSPLLDQQVCVGAVVAKEGILPDLDTALSTHLRIHSAEGFFYRDVFRDACQLPCRVISPDSLDIATIGKLDTKPWGRDQKLAALAAWQVTSQPLT